MESFLREEESLRWEGFVNECPNTVFHDSGLQSLQFVSEDTINSWKKNHNENTLVRNEFAVGRSQTCDFVT